MSSVVVITLNDVDITENVLFETTTFTAKVNGQLGDAKVRVRALDSSFVPISGQRLTLKIDDDIKWTGFAMRITKAYMFPAQDTAPAANPIPIWEIDGVDDNILFDKRIVFDVSNPAPHGAFQWAPGSWDDDIIKDIFDNYLDLSGDNIVSTGVQRVAKAILDIPGVTAYRGTVKTLADWESTAYTGTVAEAAYTWAQAMDTIQRATGAIYYIDGVSDPTQRILRYVDVETVTSDYGLTDTPDIPIHGPPVPGVLWDDQFDRVETSGSVGGNGAGGDYTWTIWDSAWPSFDQSLTYVGNGSAEVLVEIWNDDFNRTETSGFDGGNGLGVNYTWSDFDSGFASFAESLTYVTPSAIHLPSGSGNNWDSFALDGVTIPASGIAQLDFYVPDTSRMAERQPEVGMFIPLGGKSFWMYAASMGNDGSMRIMANANIAWAEHFDFSVTPGTWVTLKGQWNADGSGKLKCWPVGDTEPDWMLVSAPQPDSLTYTSPILDLYSAYTDESDLLVTNLIINEVTHAQDGNTLVLPATWWDSFLLNMAAVPSSTESRFDVYIPATGLASQQPDVGLVFPGNPGFGFYTWALDDTGLMMLSNWWNDFQTTYTVTPGTWVRVKAAWDPTTFGSIKAWPRDDPEPDWMITNITPRNVEGPSGGIPVIDLFNTPVDSNLLVDNIYITGFGAVGPSPSPDAGGIHGYSNFSIIENGSKLTNDMHVWGEALGSKLTVHSRVEDATSIATHGRWVNGYFSDGLYHQTAADTVASSYVNGTPQSLRGAKNDQVTFNCRTLMPVFRVGQVVAVVNSQFDYTADLPIREMRISFFSPDLPIFDLSLGTEIDQPWAFYESLRKMPRPWEIKRYNWHFPFPARLPYCPVPSIAGLMGVGVTGMLSIFQEDFGGFDYNSDNPTLWQNPPYGGAWGTSTILSDAVALGVAAPGFIGATTDTRKTLFFHAPNNGPSELLIAATWSEGDTNNASFNLDVGIWAISLNTGPPKTMRLTVTTLVERVIIATSDPGSADDVGIHSFISIVATADLPERYFRQPLWIRAVSVSSDLGYGGAWLKVWPRTKPEPAAWSLVFTESDIPTDPYVSGSWTFQNLGLWPVVEDALIPSWGLGSSGGIEAVSVYATTGPAAHWDLYAHHINGSAYGSISPTVVPPGTWTTDFGGSIGDPGASYGFYYWGPEPGSFSQNRYTDGLPLTNQNNLPNHRLHFSWPHFDPGWNISHLFISQVEQYVVSYDMSSAGWDTNGSFSDIGFVRKMPESVTISGDVWINDESGGLYRGRGAGYENLPFEVLLSFNWYGFGNGSPFWTTPYEILPVARTYVNYNPAAGGGELSGDDKFWKHFEFTVPVAAGAYETGQYLQWGVTWVGDMLDQFRTGLPSTEPPGRLGLPNQATVAMVFRNIQYKAAYTPDETGIYFCVPTSNRPVQGNTTGMPAIDSGDQLTYFTGSAFVSGSTTVYVNGLPRHLNVDYTEIPSAGAIVFGSPLNIDDEVVVDFEGIGPAWGLP